jgi:hypothetical protein
MSSPTPSRFVDSAWRFWCGEPCRNTGRADLRAAIGAPQESSDHLQHPLKSTPVSPQHGSCRMDFREISESRRVIVRTLVPTCEKWMAGLARIGAGIRRLAGHLQTAPRLARMPSGLFGTAVGADC